MKNALILALATAGAYLIGRKTKPSANAAPQILTVEVVGALRGSGRDLTAIIDSHNYRRLRTA